MRKRKQTSPGAWDCVCEPALPWEWFAQVFKDSHLYVSGKYSDVLWVPFVWLSTLGGIYMLRIYETSPPICFVLWAFCLNRWFLFSSVCVCVCVCVCAVAQLSPTLCNPMDHSLPGTPFMQFSKQESWSGLQLLPPGDLPDPEIESVPPVSPALAGGFFTTEPPGKPIYTFFSL